MSSENKKHLWLMEIANHFGMNTMQFAKSIGYSRQSLYCASSGSCKLRKGHIGMACFKLSVLSEKILNDDIQSAKERHEIRKNLIRDFEKRFTGGEE
jgi:hypothetical protein